MIFGWRWLDKNQDVGVLYGAALGLLAVMALVSCWSTPGIAEPRSTIRIPASGSPTAGMVAEAARLASETHYDAAILLVSKALRIDPQNSRALLLRAQCFNNIGEEEKAIEDLNQAISIDPRMDSAYMSRARTWSIVGKGTLAKADIAKAIQLSPKNAETFAAAGYVYASLKEYSKAVEYYDQAIRLNPAQVLYFNNRAMALIGAGKDKEALNDYAYVVQHWKHDEEAYSGSAKIYERQGLFSKAAHQYRLLFSHHANYSYLQSLAEALVKAKAFDEALVDCIKLIKVSPQDDELYLLRAKCYLGKHDLPRAIKDLDQCIQRSKKSNKEAYKLRASAHRLMGNRQLATDDETRLKEMEQESIR